MRRVAIGTLLLALVDCGGGGDGGAPQFALTDQAEKPLLRTP
jgi:hypothetical protein